MEYFKIAYWAKINPVKKNCKSYELENYQQTFNFPQSNITLILLEHTIF
jgi:hypothetical protein